MCQPLFIILFLLHFFLIGSWCWESRTVEIYIFYFLQLNILKKQSWKKQTENAPNNMGPENTVWKSALSCISGRMFSWYLCSTQLGLDWTPFFFHFEDTTRSHLPDSLKIMYCLIIDFYQRKVDRRDASLFQTCMLKPIVCFSMLCLLPSCWNGDSPKLI